jgi:hypothetical protein
MKGRSLITAAILLAVVAYFFRTDDPESPTVPPAPVAPPVAVPADLTVLSDSEFERSYRGAGSSAEDDLKQVAEVWQSALLLIKDYDRFPLPDNAAITAFLQGKNPHRVAWIRPGHPAVSGNGELLDRWDSPLFFHRESSRTTTFRSAGPDRKLWTEDDVVWPKP